MSRLTLMAYEPLSEIGLYHREFVDDLTGNHQNYTHTITAVGGYDSAGFSIRGTRDYLQDWFDDGLMRRVCLINPEGIISWEGFVSRMTFNNGNSPETKSIEPLYNRIYMRYAPLDLSVFPPVASDPITLILDNIASQIKYGIKAGTISGGERAASTAYEWATTVLEYSSAENSLHGETVNTSGGGEMSLEVECKGYYHTLKWIPYICTKTGYIQANQVIQEILEYYNLINQGWISQDFGWIDWNFRTARRGRNELKSCWDEILDIIKEGGKGDTERWVGGLYQNRQMIYKAAEDYLGLYATYEEVYRSMSDPAQFIFDSATGTEIKPWDMVPDRIFKTVDARAGSEAYLKYIEQVVFTEPYGLQLVGGDDMRLDVFLAQRGLSSI